MSCFVTGATGFIGRYLVRELLACVSGPVYVLVRQSAAAKLDELRHWWGAAAERVVAIDGDLREAELGVAAIDRARIGQPIEHFFHLAALYDIDASSQALAEANVAGTRNALEFAAAMGTRHFHHVSSIAAAGLYDGVFTEDMFEEACHLEHPYFRTKHDAEALVRRHCRVPWRIYRPAMVIGDSQTGHVTKTDGPYYFFKALQIMRRHVPTWLPTIGFEGGYVNLVPVDYVAAAMVRLSQLPDQDFRCFHLTDPQPRRAGEVLNLFARAGHAPLMGLRVDTDLLRSLPIDLSGVMSAYEPVRAIVEQLLDDLQLPRSVLTFVDMPTLFDNRRTRGLLQECGVCLPRLEEYGWRIWDYWERHLDPELLLDRSLAGKVANKRVLITGGNSGIGRATALRLADVGATIMIVARDPERLAAVQSEIRARGGTAHTYVCDITDDDACDTFVQRLIAEHGGVDILINNAGHSIRRSIVASYQRLHDFQRMMKLNYFAAVRLTLALLPGMEARRSGQVIVISSIGVLSNAPRFSAYVASKAAIESFARCAASEYRDRGVRFSVIDMPLVRTPMIAPTTAYSKLPALSPEQAAELVVDAIVHQSPRIASRLGTFARLLDLFAPKIADTVNSAAFRMFPDSAAALGTTVEVPPTEEAVAFAKVMHGLHW